MTTIVTDAGFAADDWNRGYVKPNAAANDAVALDLEPDADPDQIPLSPGLEMIRVNFPSFADGRGFSIARQLRLRGFAGRLRACGHVLAVLHRFI